MWPNFRSRQFLPDWEKAEENSSQMRRNHLALLYAAICRVQTTVSNSVPITYRYYENVKVRMT